MFKKLILISAVFLMFSNSYSQTISTITSCSGQFSGQSINGCCYDNNENWIRTFTPSLANNRLYFEFYGDFEILAGDTLWAFNGSTVQAPLIDYFTFKRKPSAILATNPLGSITFRFKSNSQYIAYGWNSYFTCISSSTIPGAVINILPSSFASNVNINTKLKWNIDVNYGCPSSFDIYFGTSPNPPLVASNHSFLTYNPGTLSLNTTYYWKVVPKNALGEALDCVEEEFTTFASVPILNLTYPNGGETVLEGEGIQINMNNSGFEFAPNGFNYYYSSDGGNTWFLEASNEPEGYVWVPIPTSGSLLFMIESYDYPEIYDISNSPFFSGSPNLTIISPVGGEEYYLGQNVSVAWTCNSSVGDCTNSLSFNEVEFSHSLPGLNYWYYPITNYSNPIVFEFGEPYWSPQIPGEYLFSITTSNAGWPYTMTTPVHLKKALMNYPNGGESFIQGNEIYYEIGANGAYFDFNYKIQLSTDDGLTWIDADPFYNGYIVAPNVTSQNCFVRMVSLTIPNEIIDISNSPFTINCVQQPSITSAGNLNFCQGQSATLTASNAAGFSYSWFNNGNLIPGQTNSQLIVTQSGNYSVRITQGACQSTSIITSVNVNPTPTANATATGNTTVCQGSSVTLNASVGTGYSYQWRLNGNNISAANSATYSANASGNYSVVVTANNCSATSSAIAITVNPTPTASATATGNTTVCQGSSVTLNASTGTGYSYQWRLNGNNISAANSATYSANASGNYSVLVTANNCSATSSAVAITVNPTPTASATAAGNTTVCQGSSVTLNASTGTGYSYQWRLNGNNIPTATNSSYSANSSGNYSVQITANNCSATSSEINVAINPLPTANTTAIGNTTVCQGSTVLLNANTGTGYSYQWKQNGNNIPTATNSAYSANSSGNYSVQITANNCSATSSEINVTINPLPTANATATGNTTVCQGSTVLLNASTGTGYFYQWKQNGNNIPTATNPSYSANSSGNYSVQITANNCSASSNQIQITMVENTSIINSPISQTSCLEADIQFSINATGSNLSYQWFFNGTPIPSGQTSLLLLNSIDNNDLGTYYAVVTGDCGTLTSTNAILTISNSITISQQPQNQTICEGSVLNLGVVANGSNANFQWFFNETILPGETNSFLTINSAALANSGNYYVQINSSCGNINSESASININANPIVTLNFIGSNNACQGDSIELIATNNVNFTYQWFKNSLEIIGASNFNYYANEGGNYYVEVLSNNCTSVSNNINLTIFDLPQAPTLSFSPSQNVCEGDSILVSSNYTSNVTWSTNSNSPSVTVLNSSDINCTYTDLNGCSSSSTLYPLIFYPLPEIPVVSIVNDSLFSNYSFGNQWYLNNSILTGELGQSLTIISNGSYYVCHTNSNGCESCSEPSIITSLKSEKLESEFNIYPNPFQNEIYFDDGNIEAIYRVKIYDNTSKLVLENSNIKSKQIINTNEFNKGLYFIEIFNDSDRVFHYKLMKM